MDVTSWFIGIQSTLVLMGLSLIVFFIFSGQLMGSVTTQCKPHTKTLWGLLLIVLAGLTLRVYWISITQPVPLSDFDIYHQIATRFYNGDYSYSEIARHPGTPVLYTLFFYLLGPTLLSAWVMNLLLFIVMAFLTYDLTRLLSGSMLSNPSHQSAAGLLGMGVIAFLPQSVTYSALFASEYQAVTFSLMIIWVGLRSLINQENVNTQNPLSLWHWAGLGALVYMTCLVRSSNMLFLGLLPLTYILYNLPTIKTLFSPKVLYLTIFLKKTPWLKGLLVTYACFGLLMGSWITHQYLVTGQAKILWGAELWLGCAVDYENEGRYEHTASMPAYSNPDVRAKFETYYQSQDVKDQITAFNALWDGSMDIIKEDPEKYLQYGFVRMRHIFKTAQTGVRWSAKTSPVIRQHITKRWENKLANVSNISWHVVLVLALLIWLPMMVSLSRRLFSFNAERMASMNPLGFLMSAYLVTWLVFHYLVAVASERYGYQLLPFVCMLSAVSVVVILTTLTSLFQGKSEAKSNANPSA